MPVERIQTSMDTYLAGATAPVLSSLALQDADGNPLGFVCEPPGTSAAVRSAPESNGRIGSSSGSASSRSGSSNDNIAVPPEQPATVDLPVKGTSKMRKPHGRLRNKVCAKATTEIAI
ncbi:hypothetical protein ON010_g10506 [Phytophthora cinnamomi]|nr:hypothetical protein ON010_g10506 [Phytophthora cinnamomi]